MSAKSVAEYIKTQGISEVPICDMENSGPLLTGIDGRSFYEVDTNIWADAEHDEGVMYLGTGRHGGGIVLRPLFVRMGDAWLNATTGKDAPSDLAASFNGEAHTNGAHKCAARAIGHADEFFTRQAAGIDVAAVSASSSDAPLRILGNLGELQRCEALTRISEAFSWKRQVKDVYASVCEVVADVLGCNQVHMHLMNPEGTQLVKCAYCADGNPVCEWERQLPSTIGRTQWMMRSRMPIVMDYEHPHPEDSIPPEAFEGGFMSAVSIPLQAEEEVLGMLSVVYRTHTTWSQEDLDFLVLLGRVAGTLVQRLYDTRKASELLLLDERKMLSTEIHENVSSLIGALSVNAAAAIAAFDEGDAETARVDLKRLELTAGETIRLLRDEMMSLRISLEETDGLVEGVREALEAFERGWGIETELVVSGADLPVVVPMHVSLQLTRILNECLSNIIKHAHATHVRVEVRSDLCLLSLTVNDNGCGFNVAAVDPDRFGLTIMKERAAAAGGQVRIASGEGGTVVRVEVAKRARYQEGFRNA